jgi:hypothetical protein
LLAAVYKSPGRAWGDADITELSSFKPKTILAGDLNDKIHFCTVQLQILQVTNCYIYLMQTNLKFQPRNSPPIITLAEKVTCSILWSTKISLSDVVCDILESDHLPVIFHILDHTKSRNFSNPIEKFTHWDRFECLASELISPKIKIKSGVEANKAARDFSASIASAYRLSTSKITLLDLNNDLPGLDRLLKHKQRLRKLWQ